MASPLAATCRSGSQIRLRKVFRNVRATLLALCTGLAACSGDDIPGPTDVRSAGGGTGGPAFAVSAGGYSLTDLTPDIAPQTYAFAQALNDAGDVTGVVTLNGTEHGFRWRAGVLTDLAEPGDALSNGDAINTAGVVVGYFIPTTGKGNAFRWQDGVRTTLPSLSPPNTGGDDHAKGINSSGRIVGHSVSYGSGQQLPVVWENGGISALPLPVGAAGGEATGINTAGTIVGWYVAPAADRIAIAWENGAIVNIGLLGGMRSEALAVNANGQIVGSRIVGGEERAFLWQNGTTVDLGPGRARAINAAGQIVGESGPTAVRWPSGSVVPIPIPDLTGTTTATRAGGINTGGAIVGMDLLHAYFAVPENKPPVAEAGGPYTGSEGTAVMLTAAGSTDVNGDALSYHWNFGDGTSEVTVTTTTVSHVYGDNGIFTATLTATDPGGLADEATSSVTVANVAPVVNAGADAMARPGQTVVYSATFTDAGTADRPWSYSVAWGDGTAATTGTATTQAASLDISHVYAAEGTYTATFSVTDKDAGAGSDAVVVTVASSVAPTVAITFATSPVGTGFTATIRGTGSDPDQGEGTWSLLVTWGDGSQDLTLLASLLSFTRTHTYSTPGNVTVTARITDASGVAGSASVPVVVALGIPIDVDPPALPCPPPDQPDATCVKRVGTSNTLAVALFSVSGFQPVQLQAAQVTLGDNLGSEAVASSCANVGDRNGDGVADTRCVFKKPDLKKATTTTGAQRLVLNGRLPDGRRVQGQEQVAGL
jgi:probable HAF family extracellular repeat protein